MTGIETVLANRQPWHIEPGDVMAGLRSLPSASINCVVCSPPYFGLRDYGVSGQIGLERTPAEFVAVMVEVFREVRRVLHPTGVLWLNMGDSYSGAGYSRQDNTGGAKREHGGKQRHTSVDNLPAKNLLMMPARVAIALQDDGWILRSDIIWHKSNPMPESVQDRPTKAHEYIFLFSKQERYFYDGDAVREPHKPDSLERYQHNFSRAKIDGGGLVMADAYDSVYGNPLGRNLRSVWTIPSQPFPDAHFATFPTEIPRRCILAGSSEHGVCSKCGAPWGRVTEREQPPAELRNRGNGSKMDFHTRQVGGGQKVQDWYDAHPARTLGWQPSCTCSAPTVPAVVLDPFAGSGTTLMVALRLGRRALGIDLNDSYVKLARRRIEGDAPLFNTAWRAEQEATA